MNHVFGYTVAHDVSERTWQLQKNGGQFLIGKAMDSFCPIGPVIVTKDEIKGDLLSVSLTTIHVDNFHIKPTEEINFGNL